MAIPKSVFLIYCAVLTAGLIWSYSIFADYFNQRPEVEQELSALRDQVEFEKFEKNLMAYRLKDFEKSVAEVLPVEKLNAKKQIIVSKSLMTILREPASLPPLDLSGVIYEGIKAQFKNKKFDTSVQKSKKLIETYPTSPHVVEAYFFMAESYYMLKDIKKCTEVIDLMVEQFPDHDLTGFILLRLGQISEQNSQPEEAREIYATVLSQFSNAVLKNQARQMLRTFE